MAAAAARLSLDIPETQVAINFVDDTNFRWHVVLRVRLADGRWVDWAPDLDVVVVNLADHIAVPIPRRAPAPARVRGNMCAADALTEDELTTVRLEAAALGSVLGAAPAGAGAALAAGALAADWRFASRTRRTRSSGRRRRRTSPGTR